MPSSPKLLEESLELNNEGARMIWKGEYGSAISIYSKAMGILKEMLATESCSTSLRDTGTGNHSACCDPSNCCMGRESISFIGGGADSLNPMSNHEDDESTSHFVFQKPLIMALDCGKCASDTTSTTHAKLSAVMIFNFALSYHLSAMKYTDNYSQHLQIALRLYESAYLHQQNAEADICILYSLALSNNLGHVLNATKHMTKARKCFEQLLCSLIFVLQYCNDDEKRNLQCFFRSASPCILGNTKVAPAAWIIISKWRNQVLVCILSRIISRLHS